MALKWTSALVSTAVLLSSQFYAADAHSALLANSKVLGKLNGGECFNCAIGSYPKPADIPASAVDASSDEDGIAAYAKSSGRSIKELWQDFQSGTPYGTIAEPDAIVAATSPDTCGRFSSDPPADVIPSNAKITFKKSNHNGPAEIWIDGKKVWGVDNFIRDGKAAMSPSVFACNKAECEGRWYWMGKVRVKGQWDHYQLYVQCFTIKNNSDGGAASDAVSSGNATAPATKKPSANKTPKPSKTPKATKAPKTPKPSEDESAAGSE